MMLNNLLVDLPSPSSINYFWNFGSLLGVFLGFQIFSGVFLSLYFCADVNLSFYSLVHLSRDINYGWIIRSLHANGASFFFLFIYVHMGRGVYYGSYRFKKTWLSGVFIYLLVMGAAFLGYVLPWGQMSFWAATVITNLLSAIPYVGVFLVEWIWGGFSVGNPTLIRFFSFHFFLPFVVLFFFFLHLMFLHETGSSNFMGVSSDIDSIFFYPFFIFKDLFGVFFVMIFYMFFCFIFPFFFMDVENFIFSNPLITPVHIQPEWYFLFAYTILRSVSSKIGGVIALGFSVCILFFFSYFYSHKFRSTFMYPVSMMFFWWFIINWMMLTWIGACEVEMPYSILGVFFSIFYFLFFIILWMLFEIQDLIF